jgi:hypothetical protein
VNQGGDGVQVVRGALHRSSGDSGCVLQLRHPLPDGVAPARSASPAAGTGAPTPDSERRHDEGTNHSWASATMPPPQRACIDLDSAPPSMCVTCLHLSKGFKAHKQGGQDSVEHNAESC